MTIVINTWGYFIDCEWGVLCSCKWSCTVQDAVNQSIARSS